MANTTNFGWETPDDTDLVKDGAAAMRTLGNAIDASFVDLKGGTTGQVLAKASNTDLDYTWTNVDPLTILDAAGDLITATAADTPARLAVGTNGQVLTADSTTSTGLKWATPSGGWTLLSTTTLTGQTTTISSISQSYNFLKIVVDGVNPSANGTPTINFRDSGSNNLTVNIQGAVYNAFYSQNGSSFLYLDGGANIQYYATNTSNTCTIDIDFYSTSNRKAISVYGSCLEGTGNRSNWVAAGAITSTNAIDSLFFDLPGTTTFSAGTVKIYGAN